MKQLSVFSSASNINTTESNTAGSESLGIFNINGVEYIPLPSIGNHCSYSYSRVRGLISEGKINSCNLLKICNLYFLKREYIDKLEGRRLFIRKNNLENYMIKKYYNKSL